MHLEIIPSTVCHVRELSKTIRPRDRQEAEALGFKANKMLFYSYRQALVRNTLLIDGKVAAMWGIVGQALGNIGQPYFVTGTEVEKLSPVRFARLYIKELQRMKHLFPVLENYVDGAYKGAVRMLEIAGFTLSDKILLNGHPFHRFTMVTS